MLTPLSWLKDYVDIDVTPKELEEKLFSCGFEVEESYEVGKDISNVVVGLVEECEPIPETHLSLCKVNAGEHGTFQICCGADNVKAGGKFPLALIGATVYATAKDHVTIEGVMEIKQGKLRGYDSYGMLCSGVELGLNEDLYPGAGYNGLLVLPEDAKAGADVKPILGLDDWIFDIAITANRPDCQCIYGMAREVAAVLGKELKEPATDFTADDVKKDFKVTVEAQDICPRYTAHYVHDVKMEQSPAWMRRRLALVGNNSISNIVDILEGEPYESPMKPWGGIEQLAWNATSDKVAYTCRKKTGLEYAISTNSDIYVYDLNTKKTDNITEENKGYDTNPQYSPDGKYIAWQSMERDGYEADLNRLFIMNLETGEKRFVSKAFESNVDAFIWGNDAKTIYFTGVWHGETQIYSLDLTNDSVKAITSGMYDYEGIALFGDKLIAKRHSMSMGDEIYAVALDGSATQLTQENKHIYDQLEMGKVEGRWMKTTDGKDMLTWVIYPPQFDPNKKYPTLLFCEGGPQSPVSQFWSYRWNFQIMAANDYIIVAPNRRGLPGFGVEWNEQISGDYGGQCMKDYFTAIDEMAKESYVDKDRLGCVGASFGGFSVYWLAGHHDKRFKAFIAHDGIFNMEMQYLETEEKWFANWDMGGAYWEKQNPVAQRTFANSPHLFVDKWDTPILCIHGEKDFRILANQAMAAFDAAVMRGVPAELLIYPDENHWVLKPQNGVLWQRTFFEWLDKWLKSNKQ